MLKIKNYFLFIIKNKLIIIKNVVKEKVRRDVNNEYHSYTVLFSYSTPVQRSRSLQDQWLLL